MHRDGGVFRFYRGLAPALFQGPLSRFGDTAANAGTLALLDSYDATANLNVAVKTLAASSAAALFRIALMPIDACKTIMQVLNPNPPGCRENIHPPPNSAPDQFPYVLELLFLSPSG